jgi:hypothetical protein
MPLQTNQVPPGPCCFLLFLDALLQTPAEHTPYLELSIIQPPFPRCDHDRPIARASAASKFGRISIRWKGITNTASFGSINTRLALPPSLSYLRSHRSKARLYLCACVPSTLEWFSSFHLAKNGGTSVDQTERFYARNLPL